MGKKVLCIEDESDQILMIQTRLEANGFEFFYALSGEEGLKKAQEIKPDVILLDIIMPKMDGFEVLKKIREDDNLKNTPVIMVTAKGMKHLEHECEKLGASSVLKKPYESESLVNEVKKFAS